MSEVLLGFLESVELAVVDVYRVALASGKIVTPTVGETLALLARHHQEHADGFAFAAAGAAPGAPDAAVTFDALSRLQAAPDEASVLGLASQLEESLAATHLDALSTLELEPQRRFTAQVLPVEAQHAVLVGSLLGLPPATTVPAFEPTQGAWEPAPTPTPAPIPAPTPAPAPAPATGPAGV